MFIKNEKPVKIIGFPESSVSQEYFQVFSKDGLKDVSIITPKDFKCFSEKNKYQYIIGFHIDMELRKEMCDLLDDLDLDCLTYISDSVYIFPSAKIGKGCYIGHLCIVSWNCSVGDYCHMSMTSVIGHDASVGRNCYISPRVDITGNTKVGSNCKFFYQSAMLPKTIICDGVTLGAFSNLTKNAEKPGTYVGRIARLIKPETTDKDL